MLLTKIVKNKWNPSNKRHYINKGYIFTKMKNEFDVYVEDLPNSSNAFVQVTCDCKDCITPIEKQWKWVEYKERVREGKTYCNKCTIKLFATNESNHTK